MLNVQNRSESIENRFTGRILMLVDLVDKIMLYFVLLTVCVELMIFVYMVFMVV